MKRKHITAALLALCLLLAAVGCAGRTGSPRSDALSIEHETKFGGVYLHITIDDFNALGFTCGDSVDVRFSSGLVLKDVPYYNGYYTRTGELLLCAYPGYPYVDLCFNNGDDLYVREGLTDDITATVSLHERGKYLSVQNVMGMAYGNERADFASDAVFANFRSAEGGKLAKGLVYRSASPCDDQYNRAEYADRLSEQAGIQYILDLADNAGELEDYRAGLNGKCGYWEALYAAGRVLPLDMSANYRSETYAAAVAEAMRAVVNEEGPFLIHCTEGKDRTGFVCILMEALAGADYAELERDYMQTYENYYGVTEQGDPDSYGAVKQIKLNDILSYLTGVDEPEKADAAAFVTGAEKYLAFGGMSGEEISLLKAKITA